MEENEKAKVEKIESFPSWLWGVLIGFCVLILIIGGVNSCKKNKEQNPDSPKNQTEQSDSNGSHKQKSYTLVLKNGYPKMVNLNSEYGETYNLDYLDVFAFSSATGSYCVINGANYEECSAGTEDISDKFNEEDANSKLRFKGNGTLMLFVYIKVYSN